MSPSPTHPALRPPRILLNVLVLGFMFRVINLGAWPLWLDEGATWSWTALPTWQETALGEANHPPVWWLVTRLWTSAFGDSEAALRAPAALLGVASTLLVWVLMLRVLDPALAPRRGGFPTADDGGRGRRIAAWVTGLVCVSATFLEYAQEARMYTLLLVEALALSLLYLRWLDRNDRLSLVGYGLVGVLTLYTHYFGVWILLSHAAHALWLARTHTSEASRIAPLPFLLTVGLAGLAFVPWFTYLVMSYEGIAHIAPEPFSYLVYIVWRTGIGPALAVPDRLRQAAGPLEALPEEWPVLLAGVVLWMVPLAMGALALRRRPGLRSFAAFQLLVPTVILLVIYVKFPLLHERYFLFLAPWLVLLAVLGAYGLPRWARTATLGGIVALFAVGTVAYHGASTVLVPGPRRVATLDEMPIPSAFVPDPGAPLAGLTHGHPYGREPWRQAHAFVRRHAKPGDLVALHPWYVHLVWDYYASRPTIEGEPLETLRLPAEPLSSDEILAELGGALANRRRVFLVLAHEETPDPDHYYVALRGALGRQWIAEGRGMSAVPPVLFQLSWGVRVAVFTRR